MIPEEGRLYAPADGTVENLMDTGHALGIVTKGLQAELLIHVGRDTVSLQGQHFTLHVREGDTVKAGQLLMEFDMAAIGELGFDLTTPVIVCNSSDFDLVKCGSKQVAPGDVLLTPDPQAELTLFHPSIMERRNTHEAIPVYHYRCQRHSRTACRSSGEGGAKDLPAL